MRIGFFLVMLSILTSINVYVAIRGWQALPVGSILRPLFLAAVIVLFLSIFVAMIFSPNMPALLGKAISHAAYSYLIVFVYLFLSFLVVDIIRVANYFFHFAPQGMPLFRYWAFIATLGITAILMIYGSWKFNHPEIVKLSLTAETPKQGKKIRIVAASDIHLGVTIDKGYLKKYVKMINDQHPDIVLLAGDVSDRSMIPVSRQHMDEELRQIKATKGVYAITGNHEFYAETPRATEEYLRKAGITYLRDSSALIDNSFYVLGRDDRTNVNRKEISELVEKLDRTKPVIMLDHQPYELNLTEKNGIDLQISGHTHNGQFFPGNILVKNMYELAHGYKKKGKSHIYVSSGLGIWGPQYRIGTQSELVVIDFNY